MGRPIEVEGGRNTSIRLGAKERGIVAAAAKHHLGCDTTTNRSRIVRQMIRTSWEQGREDLKESWKKDAIIADLQVKLQEALERNRRLEADLVRSQRPKGRRNGVFGILVQNKESIRARAVANSRSPSGHPMVDQAWHNRDRSWPRLLREIETAEEIGQWPLPRNQDFAIHGGTVSP